VEAGVIHTAFKYIIKNDDLIQTFFSFLAALQNDSMRTFGPSSSLSTNIYLFINLFLVQLCIFDFFFPLFRDD